MKGKYLVILLLIITFICAFCKYSKNVQVRELFIDNKEVKQLFNTGTNSELKLDELQLDDFTDISVSCTNLTVTDKYSNTVMTQLRSLYNILYNIITNYREEILEMQGSFNTNIREIQDNYNSFFDEKIINTLDAAVLSPAEEGDNVCDTHIKQRAENDKLVSQINVVLEHANWAILINDITIANSNLVTDKEGLSNEIIDSESFFNNEIISPLVGGISKDSTSTNNSYTAVDSSQSHFGKLLNAIKATNHMINNTKYIEDLDKYKVQFQALKVSLESQKKSNDVKIGKIDDVFSADNFQKEQTSSIISRSN